ncbi:MAG: TetM/TetW/TetO/TetS family tetracycline resistance ribosomal protection protein [Clostridia bacterium]|nr:TetM/TetW/TetO/TetS family tetracycline resistance ribosomal protection protein [Clostridia bacterium]
MKKKLTIGILAHVDAGKTTLSEALLYLSGKIRTLGRVDHKNTYLDTNAIERERGITIFSKQAHFSTDAADFILLDTPGHMDFSAETERTLALLDYAILVISAPDGVQNHTRTLWQLLEYYSVPTFIFVNKTDICIKFVEELEAEIADTLSKNCVAFHEKYSKSELDEHLALVHEEFLDSFLGGEPIDEYDIATLVGERRLFPCLFGSALKTSGVEFLLDALDRYTLSPIYEQKSFGARVYKILHHGGTRLTYMKITGGSLRARDEIVYLSSDGRRICEKISQIRLYSSDKYEQVESVGAGEICAVIGLSETYVGEGLGVEADTQKPILEPVLSYRIELPEGCDTRVYFPKLKQLEEEEPSLHLWWNDELSQIEARLMGEIQIDLLKRMIDERFGIKVELGAGRILYKEKIASKAIGVGHFEPLRHYAEVQLLLEPEPKGTGLIFDTRLPENSLDVNWHRLILSHLYEKDHRGVLIGASLTDTKITLVAGRAHLKHTEGGDFREATLRAVRHGLMKGGCVLLEPYYKFRIEIPSEYVGRAMTDLQNRSASFEIESAGEKYTTLSGRAPVATIGDYTRELISYTRGEGRMFCTSDGYEPCHDQDEIVAERGYDPEADLENTPHSVFCAHGAGFVVRWDEVDSYKHLDAQIEQDASESIIPKARRIAKQYSLNNDELEAIMLREFGPIKRKKYSEPKVFSADKKEHRPKKKLVSAHKNIIIIDGYNVIYSWESLKELADFSLEKARETLMDILSDYVAFTKVEIILVFDAYLVKDGVGSDFTHDGYRVVYTKQDETADAFIERMMFELGSDYSIKVVTGDKLVQFSAVSSGILRMTAKEFEDDVRRVGNEITAFVQKLAESSKK